MTIILLLTYVLSLVELIEIRAAHLVLSKLLILRILIADCVWICWLVCKLLEGAPAHLWLLVLVAVVALELLFNVQLLLTFGVRQRAPKFLAAARSWLQRVRLNLHCLKLLLVAIVSQSLNLVLLLII